MIQIRPVSDLRNRFSEIEKMVKQGEPIYLTKNGYGSMVLLSLEQYTEMTELIEQKLNEADKQAETSNIRLTHDEVFSKIRSRAHEKEI